MESIMYQLKKTEVTCICDDVYVLTDRAGGCVNLVIGKEKALVFDTGSGTDDIHGLIRRITGLPLVVINSHGHFDHIGGNGQFDTVYMHPDDFVILESYTAEILGQWRRELAPGQDGSCQPFEAGQWDKQCNNMKALDFDSFNLGGLECRVIPLRGHSRGSIGIWIPKRRLLLSGDALTPVMCLIFQNHMPVETQYHTLECVKNLDFDYYLTSHHNQWFPRQTIDRLMRCIENSGKGKWHPYQYPYPPYAKGRIYLDSMEGEPVALICESDREDDRTFYHIEETTGYPSRFR